MMKLVIIRHGGPDGDQIAEFILQHALAGDEGDREVVFDLTGCVIE